MVGGVMEMDEFLGIEKLGGHLEAVGPGWG
jgi:hypothetical protein